MIGRLTRNTEPYQKCSRRIPEATGPIAAPAPEMPAHHGNRLRPLRAGNTLARIDSVDGMTNAADTHHGGGDDQHPELSAKTPRSDPSPKTTRAGLQGSLAAETVTESGGREQQTGEHEAVGIDDPLDVGVRCPDATCRRHLQRRQSDLSTVLPTMTMMSEAHSTARVFHRREGHGRVDAVEIGPRSLRPRLVELHQSQVHIPSLRRYGSFGQIFRYASVAVTHQKSDR